MNLCACESAIEIHSAQEKKKKNCFNIKKMEKCHSFLWLLPELMALQVLLLCLFTKVELLAEKLHLSVKFSLF